MHQSNCLEFKLHFSLWPLCQRPIKEFKKKVNTKFKIHNYLQIFKIQLLFRIDETVKTINFDILERLKHFLPIHNEIMQKLPHFPIFSVN